MSTTTGVVRRTEVVPGPGARRVDGGDAPRVRTAAVSVRELSLWFGSHHVIDRASLEFPARTVTALIGPSGCGKSTLLRAMNRMHELVPSARAEGSIRLHGVEIYGPRADAVAIRRRIGMVFQRPNPFPTRSIADNVAAGLKLNGIGTRREERLEVVERALIDAGLWTEVRDRLDKPAGGLSGGQQQRLCIARALAVEPAVLLMDEPARHSTRSRPTGSSNSSPSSRAD